MNQDEQNIRLLSIFHYILGGLHILLYAGIGLFYIGMGTFMSQAMFQGSQPPSPPFMRSFFTIFGVVFMLLGVAFGILQLVVGSMLTKHKSRVFCIVIAAIECLQMPLGTVLGVFTIIVVCRPSVISLFKGLPQPMTSFPQQF